MTTTPDPALSESFDLLPDDIDGESLAREAL